MDSIKKEINSKPKVKKIKKATTAKSKAKVNSLKSKIATNESLSISKIIKKIIY